MLLAAALLSVALRAPPDVPMIPEPAVRRWDGPALVCGLAFGLQIAAGEHVVRRDPALDFILYYVDGPDGNFAIYEGNAPSPHDEEVQTGLSFPSVIAIHDSRTAAAKARGHIVPRLLVGAQRPAECSNERRGE